MNRLIYSDVQGFIYTPKGVFTAPHIRRHPWLQPALARSPSGPCYDLHIITHFVVTFDVSSCTNVHVFRVSAPDHAGKLTSFPRPPN